MAAGTLSEDEAVTRLSALAHETRLKLFRILIAAGPQGLPAGTLAERLGVSPSNLSAHLAILSHAGLVAARRDGRRRIYSVDLTEAGALIDFLVSDCCAGHPEVCEAIAPGALSCR
ncbi:transcriptional regulator [Marinicauda algicola]|uniref:Transcriptional regulator n=1 Tax=Marinicauda algicola TaxID=2029849 RepID=A0A4S2H1G2_9PROT|nr:metalloregulator ArsR/SmtB family transcription factor [Marinicauda algicola]TGY89111.1 transcriptional regulator [Marinicauda algicola]